MRKILLCTFGRVRPAARGRRSGQPSGAAQAPAIGSCTSAPTRGRRARASTPIVSRARPARSRPLGTAGLAAETENPSFLAVHPNQRFLYAVNEVSRYEGSDAGSVSAFSIDRATGTLTLLNRVSSRGGSPCHLELDRSGKWLFVANYGGGSVAAFPVHDDGKLGEASAFFQHTGSGVNAARQSGPHAHADGRVAGQPVRAGRGSRAGQGVQLPAGPGQGRSRAGARSSRRSPPGSGPRHLAFRPDGKFVYVLKEMLSAVVAFRYDAGGGTLAELQTLSTLPEGFSGENSGAEIAAHPSGKFLYTSNRGDDSIAIFRIDAAQGDADSRRARLDARQDPARFRDRSVRPLPRGRQSELRHPRHLPDRSGELAASRPWGHRWRCRRPSAWCFQTVKRALGGSASQRSPRGFVIS